MRARTTDSAALLLPVQGARPRRWTPPCLAMIADVASRREDTGKTDRRCRHASADADIRSTPAPIRHLRIQAGAYML
eukprot:1355383-Rhodomonas_salina.1